MHNSTKEYVKRCFLAKMDQCGITLEDLQICLDELKEERIFENELCPEQIDLHKKLHEISEELNTLHTHTSI